MSLRGQIKLATKRAMKAQKSVSEIIDYTSRGEEGTYNAATDTYSSDDKTLPKVRAIFTSYEEEKVDGNDIRPMDERCTIELRHLPGVDPKENDFITRSGAKAGVWEVKSVKLPTGTALVILQVRRP